MPSTANHKEAEQRYSELYQRYGKPLEVDHKGEYLAVSPKGKTILGSTLLQVVKQATEQFGPGNVVYKVGEAAVGKCRLRQSLVGSGAGWRA